MVRHFFYEKNQDGSWMVKCCKDNGCFSTKVWVRRKVMDGVCPICFEPVKRHK